MNDKKLATIFGITFIGGAILWGGMAYWINQANGGILMNKMADLFSVGEGYYMLLITLVFGGLFAGLGGMSGRSIRGIIFPH